MSGSQSENCYIREQIGGMRSDIQNLKGDVALIMKKLDEGQEHMKKQDEFQNRFLGFVSLGALVLSGLGTAIVFITKYIFDRLFHVQ